MSEAELILAKLKIVSEAEERGMYLCDKEHSKILLDYITNLQSKIEAYELFDNQKIANLQEENDKLQERIDKTIEYVNNHSEMTDLQINGIENVLAFRGSCQYLLEILKGVDKE